MTNNRHNEQTKKVIVLAPVFAVVLGAYVLLALSEPATEYLILASAAVAVVTVVGALWLIGPERLQRLLPLEHLRQGLSGKWTCAACGWHQSARAYRCDNCGALNPTRIWHCEVCETDVPEDLSHCPECGTTKPVPRSER